MLEQSPQPLSLSNIFRPEVRADPYPFYRALRAEDPVHWDETLGFWIHMTAADTWEIAGNAPDTTNVSLLDNAGGWNLVAYPSAVNGTLPDVLIDHGVGTDFTLVYAYHADEPADPWKIFDRNAPAFANDLTQLTPGWGYWIKVSADHTWNVSYAAR